MGVNRRPVVQIKELEYVRGGSVAPTGRKRPGGVALVPFAATDRKRPSAAQRGEARAAVVAMKRLTAAWDDAWNALEDTRANPTRHTPLDAPRAQAALELVEDCIAGNTSAAGVVDASAALARLREERSRQLHLDAALVFHRDLVDAPDALSEPRRWARAKSLFWALRGVGAAASVDETGEIDAAATAIAGSEAVRTLLANPDRGPKAAACEAAAAFVTKLRPDLPRVGWTSVRRLWDAYEAAPELAGIGLAPLEPVLVQLPQCQARVPSAATNGSRRRRRRGT